MGSSGSSGINAVHGDSNLCADNAKTSCVCLLKDAVGTKYYTDRNEVKKDLFQLKSGVAAAEVELQFAIDLETEFEGEEDVAKSEIVEEVSNYVNILAGAFIG